MSYLDTFNRVEDLKEQYSKEELRAMIDSYETGEALTVEGARDLDDLYEALYNDINLRQDL